MTNLTPSLPMSEANSAVLLQTLTAEKTRRSIENRLAYYKPYPKQFEFHSAGARHRERLLMAGNVEGWYCVVDNAVVLTDADGKPIDSEKHHLAPGQDAHLLACRLVRGRRSSAVPRGFSDRFLYQKLKY
jgi:hypothetical protein